MSCSGCAWILRPPCDTQAPGSTLGGTLPRSLCRGGGQTPSSLKELRGWGRRQLVDRLGPARYHQGCDGDGWGGRRGKGGAAWGAKPELSLCFMVAKVTLTISAAQSIAVSPWNVWKLQKDARKSMKAAQGAHSGAGALRWGGGARGCGPHGLGRKSSYSNCEEGKSGHPPQHLSFLTLTVG